MFVMELASRGDLRSYLRECRPTGDRSTHLNQQQMMKMMIDIANGMSFLGSFGYVHKDLSARFVMWYCAVLFWDCYRNCLVAANLTVKITEFGLSEQVEHVECLRILMARLFADLWQDFRKRGEGWLPMRWMAPEVRFQTAYQSFDCIISVTGASNWSILDQERLLVNVGN